MQNARKISSKNGKIFHILKCTKNASKKEKFQSKSPLKMRKIEFYKYAKKGKINSKNNKNKRRDFEAYLWALWGYEPR